MLDYNIFFNFIKIVIDNVYNNVYYKGIKSREVKMKEQKNLKKRVGGIMKKLLLSMCFFGVLGVLNGCGSEQTCTQIGDNKYSCYYSDKDIYLTCNYPTGDFVEDLEEELDYEKEFDCYFVPQLHPTSNIAWCQYQQERINCRDLSLY
jgi:hypothetical protein